MYTLNKLRNELFLDDETTRVELEKKLARSPSGARSKHSNVRPFLGLQMEWKAARGQRNFTIVSLAIGSRGSRRTRLIAISSSHLRAARPGKSRLAHARGQLTRIHGRLGAFRITSASGNDPWRNRIPRVGAQTAGQRGKKLVER